MSLGRRPKSRLDLLTPLIAERVESRQQRQKQQHDASSRDRCFMEEDTVFVKNFQAGDKWLPGIISKRTGPVSFKVQLSNGCIRRCHQDQLQRRTVDVTMEESIEMEIPTPPANSCNSQLPTETEPSVPVSQPAISVPDPPLRKTYPSRRRTTVQRYEPSW